MIRHEELHNLRVAFTDALKKAAQEAKTEDEFAWIESVATDTLTAMPPTILSKDYIERGTIATYLNEEDRQNTKKINAFMMQIYKDDLFHMNDDYLCDDLQYAAEKFYNEQKD
jgi:hypothetical protein